MPSYYSAVDRGYRLRLDLTQVSQDIANNTSLVSYALVLEATTSHFQNFRCTVNLTIDSVSVFSNTSLNVSLPSTYSSVTLTSGQRTISHNADGSKNLSFVANFSVNSPQWYTPAGTMTINDSMALTTIPRASVPTLSVSTQVMGNAITINTNRASTSFTHTLKYVFGNQSGTIATGVTTSHAWTLPLALANAIPNNESGSGTITCETYNGSTLIGTKSVSFTATVPTSVVPTINSVTIAEAVSGLAVKFLGYVQSKSRLNVVTSASGAYSSTISLIRITIESKNYNGSNITTDILTGSGTLVLSVLVTDSRGRSVTQNINVTVIAYTNPVINSMDAYRVNGSGVPSDDGTSIAVPTNFAIASVNSRNDKTWNLQYRVVGAPSWSSLSSGSVYTYNQTYTNLTGLFSGNNSYEIRLTISDYFTSIERIVTIGTAFTLINMRSTGKGIAFGKVSEKDEFEVGMPLDFTEMPKVSGVPIDVKFVNRTFLNTQIQLSTYRRSVIALCEVTNTNNELSSYSRGTLTFKRFNGLSGSPILSVLVGIEKRYNTSSPQGHILNLGGDANIAPRLCTFNYNGVKYGGLEFYYNPAQHQITLFEGISNFNIFGLDYFNTQTSTALNTEVNSSLAYDVYYMGRPYYNTNEMWHAGNSSPIIESGGNSSGGYAKFADGTLHCWGTSSTSSTAWTWTYPATFLDAPRVFALPTVNTTVWHGTKTNTSAVINSGVANFMQAFAIGRWK